MKNLYKIILFTVILLNSLCLFANEKQYQYLSFYNPVIRHSSNNFLNDGFSLGYSFPGFFSVETGELDFYYKTENNTSYSLGIGWIYWNIGLSKRIWNKYYYNMNIGPFYGTAGFSKINKIGKNGIGEIAVDFFYNKGSEDDFFYYFSPYSKGGIFWWNYSKQLGKKFSINSNIGISYSYFRKIKRITQENNWIYVTAKSEDRYSKQKQIYDKMWDTEIFFPFCVSICYNF